MGKPRIEKNNTTKQWRKVPLQVISYVRVLHQGYSWRMADIQKLKYPNIARRTISHMQTSRQEKKKSKTDESSTKADQDCSMIVMAVY